MSLTETEYKAQGLEIKEKNCSICINGLKLSTASVVRNIHKNTVRYLCSKGLIFPKCRGIKNGFRIK